MANEGSYRHAAPPQSLATGQAVEELGIPCELNNLTRAVDVLENAVKRMLDRTSGVVTQCPNAPTAECAAIPPDRARSAVGEQIRTERKRVDVLAAALNNRMEEMEV